MQTCSSHEVWTIDEINDDCGEEKSIVRNLSKELCKNQTHHKVHHQIDRTFNALLEMFNANVSHEEIKKHLEKHLNVTNETNYYFAQDKDKLTSRVSSKIVMNKSKRRETIQPEVRNQSIGYHKFQTVESYDSSIGSTPLNTSDKNIRNSRQLKTPSPYKSSLKGNCSSDKASKNVRFNLYEESRQASGMRWNTPVKHTDLIFDNQDIFSPGNDLNFKKIESIRVPKEIYNESAPFESTVMDIIAALEERKQIKLNITPDSHVCKISKNSGFSISKIWVFIGTLLLLLIWIVPHYWMNHSYRENLSLMESQYKDKLLSLENENLSLNAEISKITKELAEKSKELEAVKAENQSMISLMDSHIKQIEKNL